MSIRFLVISVSLLMGNIAFFVQSEGVTLGQPSYGGSGCPQGTASAILSHDYHSLSILFDNFVAEAGGYNARRMSRKSCNVAIPLHVPQGYSTSIFKIDYRGFHNIPYGGYTKFAVEYFFAGETGIRLSKKFLGPMEANYTLRNHVSRNSNVWSDCGKDVILRSNMIPSFLIQKKIPSYPDKNDFPKDQHTVVLVEGVTNAKSVDLLVCLGQ